MRNHPLNGLEALIRCSLGDDIDLIEKTNVIRGPLRQMNGGFLSVSGVVFHMEKISRIDFNIMNRIARIHL